ncbi:MAG: hypothetical protein HY744_34740 [Deltaproteobacteria bacterium]|nr:hypothetical protein [Deltaproteobacteria bacterium]
MPRNHPLGDNGQVEIRLNDQLPIYAADILDANGAPVLPRQVPYEKAVQLLLTDGNEADSGAYVDVRIDPAQVLALVPVDDTCEHLSGTFRCTASEDGFANFVLRSEADWSGQAELAVTGGAGATKAIEVKPAGLPAEAANFRLIIGQTDEDTGKVLATYSRLACSIGPKPDLPESQWPDGQIRVREAWVRADPPPTQPGAIEHAPAIVQSLHPEGMLSLLGNCAGRSSRLRVQLDAKGESPRFYLCFSDLGGTVELTYRSGEKTEENPRTLVVEPEPLLLRVRQLNPALVAGGSALPAVEVSAFAAGAVQVAMPIDITSDEPAVLVPNFATMMLDGEPNPPLQVTVDALAAGEARLQVTPRLFSQPRCESLPFTVVEPEY